MPSAPSKLIWIACAEVVYLTRGERVATCVEGPAHRLDLSILQSMRRHLLDPTESDLFVYAPYDQSNREQFEENANSTHLEHIYTQLEHLGPAVQIRVPRDLTRQELTNWFLHNLDVAEHAVPGQKAFWLRFSGWMVWYNPDYLVPPPREQINNCVLNNWNKYHCYRMIESYEQQGGFLYDRVIYVRNDMFFLQDLPPLSKMAHEYLWIPEGSDFRSLNDRYAIMPRHYMHQYLSRADRFFDGSAMRWIQSSTWPHDGDDNIHSVTLNNCERFLALNVYNLPRREEIFEPGQMKNGSIQDVGRSSVLSGAPIEVARFLPVSFVACALDPVGDEYRIHNCHDVKHLGFDLAEAANHLFEGFDAEKLGVKHAVGEIQDAAAIFLLLAGYTTWGKYEWVLTRRGLPGSRVYPTVCMLDYLDGPSYKGMCCDSDYMGGNPHC